MVYIYMCNRYDSYKTAHIERIGYAANVKFLEVHV